MAEPAWHRRERAERAQARALVRTFKAGHRLAAHHGSDPGVAVAGPMACRTLSQAERMVLQSLLGGWRGASGNDRGGRAGGGQARGKKDGIPNWDCSCGHTDNWGTRPVCKRCGREAPKRILRLQALKGTVPPPTPQRPSPPPPGPNPSPPGAPPNPPGHSAGQGDWRKEGKGGKSTPEAPAASGGTPPKAPAADSPAETNLRKRLDAMRQNIRQAKGNGTEEDMIEQMQQRADHLQAQLDAMKPLDARFRSLLDQKTAAEGKVAAAEGKVLKAKDALAEAETEAKAAKAKQAEVEAQIEAVRRQQQAEEEAKKPKPPPPAPDQSSIINMLALRLTANSLPEGERQGCLTLLQSMGVGPREAADRALAITRGTEPAPPVGAAASSSGGQTGAPVAVQPAAAGLGQNQGGAPGGSSDGGRPLVRPAPDPETPESCAAKRAKRDEMVKAYDQLDVALKAEADVRRELSRHQAAAHAAQQVVAESEAPEDADSAENGQLTAARDTLTATEGRLAHATGATTAARARIAELTSVGDAPMSD